MRVITGEDNPAAAVTLGRGGRTVTLAGATVGAVLLAIPAVTGDWSHFLRSYLSFFGFFLSISLGGLFFVLLQHLTGAGWSVTVRRLAEAIAANVLLLAILMIPLVAGLNSLYEWTHAGPGDHLLAGKAAWLNPAFFVVRVAVYFGVWTLSARWLLRTSCRQDETGDPALTRSMQRASPLLMVLYGITVTFGAFDLFMSLDPHWYSTIFGVYFWSGGMVGFFAFLAVTLFILKQQGKLREEVTEEHWHDVGKQLFGWNVFWAYIAFSQYMLIWYANIPEETAWYHARQQGDWGTVGLILLFGHFLLPFLLMLPRVMKRRPAVVAALGAWLLLMHLVDIHYLIAPEGGVERVPVGATEIAGFLGHLLLYTAGLAFLLSGRHLVPVKDPRLPESLAFENV